MSLNVTRWGIFNPSTKTVQGDYLSVDGVEVDLREAAQLECSRAKRAHPENPAFHMRPMFYTGSPYGAEILDLFLGAAHPHQPSHREE